MSGPDFQWRERCDRYFSSLLDANHTETTGSKSHPRGKQKKKKREKKYRANKETNYERFDEASKHRNIPTPHHVTTFTTKAEPMKGTIRWLSVLDLHGTSMLLRGRSILYCLFWITVSILATILFGVFVFMFVSNYLDDTTTFKVRMSHDQSVPSPMSLVLCNANLLRMSTVSPGSRFQGLKNLTIQNLSTIQTNPAQNPNEVLQGTELLKILESASVKLSDLPLDDLQAEFIHYSLMGSDTDWDAVATAAQQLNFNPFPKALRMTASEMRLSGPDLKSDVLQCTKNGRHCGSGELTSELHRDLGNCAALHLSLEHSWFSAADLTVDLRTEEFIPGVSPEVPSVYVFLRTSSDRLPLSVSQAVFAASGNTLQLALTKTKEVNHLRDGGGCETDSNYSKTLCEGQCLELHAARVCGCSLGLDSPLVQRCRVSVQYEFLCYRSLEILAQQHKLSCECKPNCREEFVQMSALSHPWFTDQSEIRLREYLEATGRNRNFTQLSLSQSILKIQVRMMSGKYEQLEEEREVSLLHLLVNLGAISALTCGVSVVTALELVWILGKMLVYMCCAVIKTKDERDDKVEFLPPPSMIRPSPVYDHSDTYRWVAYTGNGPPYPLHSHTQPGDMAPAIFMMPPPPRDYPGATPDGLYTVPGGRNFYFRGSDKPLNDNSSENNAVPSRSHNDSENISDAGSDVVVGEVLDDSGLRQSPRVAVVAAPAALFSHPWERPGRHESHRTVLNTSQPGDGPAGMPLFNVPTPPGGHPGQTEDLRLHGLDQLHPSDSSSDDEGQLAPRSSSPLYRVERASGPRARVGEDKARSGPAVIFNGDVLEQVTSPDTEHTGGARPDGPGARSRDLPDKPGPNVGGGRKTAWSENTPKRTGQTKSESNQRNILQTKTETANILNGHTKLHGVGERPQFFPRTVPIQPNTWYVPEFQRVDFYDGKFSHAPRDERPAYLMYHGATNGHI